jgi:DNA modification methylase
MSLLLSQANALRIPLADQSVHCVVTSPPYWGLRDYGLPLLVWPPSQDNGAWRTCRHEWGDEIPGDLRGGSGPNAKEAYAGDGKNTYARQVGRGSWCQKCGAWRGYLGLEPAPELYIEHIVMIFHEIRRVLRDDGVVWLNLGDSYAATPKGSLAGQDKSGLTSTRTQEHSPTGIDKLKGSGIKPKDLCGIPWHVAFALQADGWWLRSDIIWAKGVSFCDSYAGSSMPESVNGWRWERHRIRTTPSARADESHYLAAAYDRPNSARNGRDFVDHSDEYVNCPGCPKCKATGGYVLRRGSWRPSSTHEYLFMLAKSDSYFCDREAVKEQSNSGPSDVRKMIEQRARIDGKHKTLNDPLSKASAATNIGRKRAVGSPAGRNLRSVWVINPGSYPGAHFATFPPALVEPCIKAGTSERGVCPICGAPWARVIARTDQGFADRTFRSPYKTNTSGMTNATGKTTLTKLIETITEDWLPTCNHDTDPIPATVLDPFAGTCTTLQVARALGRHAIGLDLSMPYLHQAKERLGFMALEEWRDGRQADEPNLEDLPLFNC